MLILTSLNETIYEKESLGKMDSYDVFLSGPSSYIEIENKNKETKRECSYTI